MIDELKEIVAIYLEGEELEEEDWTDRAEYFIESVIKLVKEAS